jgi:2-iminoacetate synthase
MDCFIDEKKLSSFLEKKSGRNEIATILQKALSLKGLNIQEAAALLNLSNEEDMELLFQTAKTVKKRIYGDRLVLFAPLYVSNNCSNNCKYCGFRSANKTLHRKKLSLDEVQREVRLLLEEGHKRILMLMGESEQYPLEAFLKAVEAAYAVTDARGNSLRRINVEIASLSHEDLKRLLQVKIGTYTVFQETYHKKTYQEMHPSGKKADYEWRLLTMDRALESGLHDVGIGALFGLYDYRFEVLSVLEHARHLEEKFGVGPHTVSVPRIEPTQAPAAKKIPHPVSDLEFKKIVATLRCSLPYTGIILSTRESALFREELLHLGISQMSAGSQTSPGGYQEAFLHKKSEGQFHINDTRPLDEVVFSILQSGFIPSFCTGCYRRGRVGKDFMDLAKPGLIQDHCLPNALLTLEEYLLDYAKKETKQKGHELIEKKLAEMTHDRVREKTKSFLKRVQKGERDLYF